MPEISKFLVLKYEFSSWIMRHRTSMQNTVTRKNLLVSTLES
jgi:hypothetical protein